MVGTQVSNLYVRSSSHSSPYLLHICHEGTLFPANLSPFEVTLISMPLSRFARGISFADVISVMHSLVKLTQSSIFDRARQTELMIHAQCGTQRYV